MRRRKKALKSLIKLRRHRLDEIRKDVLEQQAMYDETQQTIDTTKAVMNEEQRLVAADPLYFQSLGLYLAASQRKVDMYSHQLTSISESLEVARGKLGEAYQEAKRFEIALEAHERREVEAEKVEERKKMDEIGGRGVSGVESTLSGRL